MIRTYLPCLLLLALPTAMGISESYIPRSDFIQGERSIPDTLHELVFSIKQRNINVAKTELYERSTPGNPKYQKWLSSGEIKELIQNDEGADAVLAWLSSNGLAIKWESYRREYMKVVAPISRWEELLDMEFYNWEDLSKKDTNSKQDHSFINRAKEYTIPAVLESHLSAIFHTVQVPPVFKPHYKRHLDFDATELSTNLRIRKLDDNESKLSKGLQASKTVTISWLNSMYVIESNTGSEQYNQSVFETSSEFYSQDDSTQFQQQYNLPLQQMIEKNGQETSSCNAINDCSEGNLDVQYISGIAQGTGTIYWYVPGNDAFVDWITAVSDEVNPPMSNSISWGTVEQYQAVSTMQQFDYQAMILGLQGVTITVSSGDDGVSGNSCSCTSASGSRLGHWSGATSWTGSGYFPSFPATSPHVTAVGATMGPGGRPSLTSEVVCQSDGGGIVTSGGGFSTYYARPPWQNQAITQYFDGLSSAPDAGYNVNGRAYPDVSFTGVYYEVVIAGVTELLFGTSASAPVMAALVTLVNSNRLAKGLGPIGFLNPTLYLNYTNITYNDVTSGDNKCCASSISKPVCCSSGFEAAIGWDPTTGWGSVDLPHLSDLFQGNISHYVVDTSSDGSSGPALSAGGLIAIIIVVVGLALATLCICAYYCAGLMFKKKKETKTMTENPIAIRLHNVQ